MSKDNGGPAFPATFEEMARYAETGYWSAAHGMTLRDYFASKAMQAIISKTPFLEFPEDFQPHEKTAIGAYEYADAMLKERSK